MRRQRIFHIKFIGLLMSVVCTGLCSCIYDGGMPDEPHQDPQSLHVTYRIVMQHTESEHTTASRGVAPDDNRSDTWGDPYATSDAIPFESRLLKDFFHVTFYNTADKSYLGKLDYVTCTNLSQGKDGDIYEFRGVLTLQDPNTTVETLRAMTVKMMVTANASGDVDFTDISSINAGAGSLTFNKIGQQGDFDAIPMWGVNQKEMKDIEPGKTYDMGEIPLLRAMAKVELCVDPSIASNKKVTIKSVSINRANTSGYALPGKWNTLTATTDLKFSETLRIPSDVNSATDRSFGPNDKGTVIFYLPECTNEAGGKEIILTVDYTVGTETRTGMIYFRPYDSNGKPSDSPLWDIVRNHHYRYEIVGIGSTDDEIKVDVKVSLNWDDMIELEPGYGGDNDYEYN